MAELTTDVLDVFRPPSGYSFRSGVALTHDCDWEHVTDTIAPALAGCEDRIPLVRRRAAQATPGMQLLVVADGREPAGGPGHTWARLVRTGGRRQHAKAGLLEFISPRGHRRVRAYVASSNLTQSGTASNWELVVVDEHGAGTTRPSLVADVAMMLTAAVKHLEVPDAHRRLLRSAVRAIRTGLKAAPAGALVHSLDQPRALLGGLGPAVPVERVVIVSPAFAAGGDDKAAASVGPWIGDRTTVDLITQSGHDGVLRFSQAALGKLRQLTGSAGVAVHNVPLDPQDEEGGRQRRLHAKALAVVADGEARLLVGSANFSAPGLLGSNREAVVALSMTADDLDRVLEELPHSRHKGPVGKQHPSVWDRTSPTPTVVAWFEPDPSLPVSDPANLVGRLQLDTAGLEVIRVVYDGNELPGWQDHHLTVRADVGVITVVVLQDGEEVPVTVPLELRLTDDQLEHWPVGDRLEPLTELERLLGTIRVTARSTRDPAATGATKAVGVTDDKFVIPLQQRLVLLARYRPQVAPLFRAYWHSDRQRLSRLLKDDELRLATALFGLDDDPPTPLLGSLAAAADALHELREPQ